MNVHKIAQFGVKLWIKLCPINVNYMRVMYNIKLSLDMHENACGKSKFLLE